MKDWKDQAGAKLDEQALERVTGGTQKEYLEVAKALQKKLGLEELPSEGKAVRLLMDRLDVQANFHTGSGGYEEKAATYEMIAGEDRGKPRNQQWVLEQIAKL